MVLIFMPPSKVKLESGYNCIIFDRVMPLWLRKIICSSFSLWMFPRGGGIRVSQTSLVYDKMIIMIFMFLLYIVEGVDINVFTLLIRKLLPGSVLVFIISTILCFRQFNSSHCSYRELLQDPCLNFSVLIVIIKKY